MGKCIAFLAVIVLFFCSFFLQACNIPETGIILQATVTEPENRNSLERSYPFFPNAYRGITKYPGAFSVDNPTGLRISLSPEGAPRDVQVLDPGRGGVFVLPEKLIQTSRSQVIIFEAWRSGPVGWENLSSKRVTINLPQDDLVISVSEYWFPGPKR